MPVVHTVELLDWATGGPAPARDRASENRDQRGGGRSDRDPHDVKAGSKPYSFSRSMIAKVFGSSLT